MKRRRAERRARRWQLLWRAGRRLLQVALVVGIGGGSAWAVPRISVAVRDHPYFRVKQIELRGDETVDRESVLAAADLHIGMSIWRVSPSVASENIEALAWIRRAIVRREFPNRVVVAVAERKPAAIGLLGGFQYLDRAGHILGPVHAGELMNYPFVTGLSGANLDGAGAQVLRRALRLVRLCQRQDCGGGISEVHIDAERGLILIPRASPVPVVMGWGGWKRKLERMDRVLAAWHGQESRLAVVDVTFRRSVVVKLRDQKKVSPVKNPGRGMSI